MSQFEDNNPFAEDYSQPSSFSAPSLPEEQQRPQPPKKEEQEEDDNDDTRAYSSRIQQILCQTPTPVITITDAGKSQEGSTSSYISYTIRTGDLSVRRRYSEFESLRNCLVRLFPTLIIPPIPEKHSFSDYAAAPTKAKEDTNVIDHRRRMLSVFLNRLLSMTQINHSSVFERFLDPNVSWSEVLNSPPVSSLPKSLLQSDPIDPASTSEAHSYLPIPGGPGKLKSKDGVTINDEQQQPQPTSPDEFYQVEKAAKEYEMIISSGLEKANRRIIKRYIELSGDFEEMGAVYNVYSLNESGSIASAIEKIGQAVDTNYMTTADLVASLSHQFTEPLGESVQFASIVRSVLKYRRQKAIQLDMTRESLHAKQKQLNGLESAENSAQRISNALEQLSTDDITQQEQEQPQQPSAAISNKKSSLSGFKIPGFGKLNHAIHGIIDVDPVATRRNNIGKTKEQIIQCQQALSAAQSDLQQASASIKKDISRFQSTKEQDLRQMLIHYAKCHIEWANKNLQAWKEAELQVDKIVISAKPSDY